MCGAARPIPFPDTLPLFLLLIPLNPIPAFLSAHTSNTAASSTRQTTSGKAPIPNIHARAKGGREGAIAPEDEEHALYCNADVTVRNGGSTSLVMTSDACCMHSNPLPSVVLLPMKVIAEMRQMNCSCWGCCKLYSASSAGSRGWRQLNRLRAEIWSKITLGRCSRSHNEAECRRSGKGAASRALARVCRQNKACGAAAKPRSSSSTGSHNWDGGGEEARGTVQCDGCNKTCRLL